MRKSHLRRLGIVFGAVCAAVACGSSTAPDPATASFASSLNVDVATMTKTSTGLYYKDSVVGTGTQAASLSTVGVHYRGWLVNATVFDSNTASMQPLSFKIGHGDVIQGWDEGVRGMKVGGWRKLVIPADLGYGKAGKGSIPSNAILVFNIQLVTVQ